MIMSDIPGCACRRHEVGLATIVSLLRIGRINKPSGLWAWRPADVPASTLPSCRSDRSQEMRDDT